MLVSGMPHGHLTKDRVGSRVWSWAELKSGWKDRGKGGTEVQGAEGCRKIHYTGEASIFSIGLALIIEYKYVCIQCWPPNRISVPVFAMKQ